MTDKSTWAWFNFFYNHGWWFYSVLVLNEKYGFAPFNRMLHSESAFIEWFALLISTVLAFGLAPSIIGLARLNINPWAGAIVLVGILGYL
jgi:hypothetical protein